MLWSASLSHSDCRECHQRVGNISYLPGIDLSKTLTILRNGINHSQWNPFWGMASTNHQPRGGKFAVELHPGIQISNKEVTVKPNLPCMLKTRFPLLYTSISLQGVKLIFFPDSHLAPKFFKVVANWKKVGRHFQRQTKPSFKPSAF